MGYSKLHSSIVGSSLWTEPDPVRILFITLLAMAGPDGCVYGSKGGLSRIANIKKDDIESSFNSLLSPDSDSCDMMRCPENEGRRIEEIAGGFRLINYDYYRNLRNDDDRREQTKLAVRKHRERKKITVIESNEMKADVSEDKPSKPRKAQAEAEAEAVNPPTPLGENLTPSANDLEPQDAARALTELLGVSGYTALAARDAVGTVKRRRPELRYTEIPEFVLKLWREVSSQPKRALPSVKTFLSEIGQYIESDHWRVKPVDTGPMLDENGGYYDGKTYVTAEGKRLPNYVPRKKANAI
jgi:hypothetical protein